MPKFYFTYGSGGDQPFDGGWTEVEAEDLRMACDTFRAIHPDRIPNCLNCSSVYSEEQFKKSCMSDEHGNFGKFCHERIAITCTPADPYEYPGADTPNEQKGDNA